VVDNGSSAPLRLGPARLLRPERNLGFAGGANAGIAAARAPIVLMLNPDVVPEDGSARPPARRLRRLAGRRRSGAAAARAGRRAADRLAAPSPALRLGLLLHALPLGRAEAAAEPPAGAPVEQPAAAALALRRDVLAAVGGLDAVFHPAWFEDVDLARRLRAHGAVLRYWPAARFRHHLGSTVPRLGYGPFLWIYYRNLTRYLEKHHGRGWAMAARGPGPWRRRPPDGSAAAPAAPVSLTDGRRPGLAAVLAGTLTGWRRPRAFRGAPEEIAA
jgi:N-acetylglucosaminyl-diphospho-decaprenol L-rhamnosyltransferase